MKYVQKIQVAKNLMIKVFTYTVAHPYITSVKYVQYPTVFEKKE